jgi:hypothetical protein
VDRHRGNVVYQVDANGNITGIQGIDNDSSFGPRKWNANDITSVKVISKSLESRLKKLTPEMFRFALRGRGLSDDELNASVERLKTLKSRIKQKKIRVVEDNQFSTVVAADLINTNNNEHDSARDILTFIREISNMRHERRMPFEPYVENIPEKSKVSTTERKYTIGGLVDLSGEDK